RRRELLRGLLALVEFDCAGNTVAGAASELSLVVYRRAFRAQINGSRQPLREPDKGGPVHKVAVVGQISNPAVSAMGRRLADRKLRQRASDARIGSFTLRSAPATCSTSHVLSSS